jgi:hypothetical protein
MLLLEALTCRTLRSADAFEPDDRTMHVGRLDVPRLWWTAAGLSGFRVVPQPPFMVYSHHVIVL